MIILDIEDGQCPNGSLFAPLQLDRDGLHDLNVQGEWQIKGGTYWVRYIHVELLGFTPQCAPDSNIKVGDRVRVRRTVVSPKYKWGSVTHQSIGTVTGEKKSLFHFCFFFLSDFGLLFRFKFCLVLLLWLICSFILRCLKFQKVLVFVKGEI